jgi:transposase
MQVCAPGMIVRAGSERIKTDTRDAIKLARLHAAGQLVLVHVPTLEHEQLRDLSRCRRRRAPRPDARQARIGKFLLRREIYYPGRGRAWTREHRAWLASLRFADRASEATFADYLHGHDTLAARRDELDRGIDEAPT